MNLKPLGHQLDELPVSLTRDRVIEYFEGERLIVFRSGANDPYLKIWSNTDGRLARWIVLRITDNDMARFLHADVSLRQVILCARDGHVYIVDSDRDIASRVAFLRVKDIPPEDLP